MPKSAMSVRTLAYSRRPSRFPKQAADSEAGLSSLPQPAPAKPPKGKPGPKAKPKPEVTTEAMLPPPAFVVHLKQ